MKTLIIPVIYRGEIPEHVRHVFHLDKADYAYTIVREGENLPDRREVRQVVILFGDNDTDRRSAIDTEQQLAVYYPGTPVLSLSVELEAPEPPEDYISRGVGRRTDYPEIWEKKLR